MFFGHDGRRRRIGADSRCRQHLGGDESLQILLDAGDIMNLPLGRLPRASGVAKTYLRGGEELPPLVRGLALT
jgi:hypothetical protein